MILAHTSSLQETLTSEDKTSGGVATQISCRWLEIREPFPNTSLRPTSNSFPSFDRLGNEEKVMLIKMTVRGIALDPITNMPIVILKDPEERRALPIWVGIFEANAIALELEKVSTPRPMTHDLLKNILEGLGITVQQVIVNDLKENTFYATIELNYNGSVVSIDSRPSDAIALALRVNAPIFVTENVVTQAKNIEVSEEKEETDKWKEWLENLKPEDFGKYKM